MPDKGNSLDQKAFKKLSKLYILALSAIAVVVIISQLLVHSYLDDQEYDSTVVNVAGRQRMLSQKITKGALMLLTTDDPGERQQIHQDLEEDLELWTFSHRALQEGNDSLGLPGSNTPPVSQLYGEIEINFLAMSRAAREILGKLEQNASLPGEGFTGEVTIIRENEPAFLQGMDEIVDRYEEEAGDKLQRLRELELLLLGITLLILLAELLFIFWPAARTVKRTIQKLLLAEKNAMTMAHNADALSEAKENSVKELRALNQAMNQTLLFARLSSQGNIIQLGEKFSRLFKIRKYGNFSKFSELLSIHENERAEIENLLEENRRKGWQGEVRATTAENKKIWLEMSLIPFNPLDDQWEILVIASDITARKEAQLEIERLTRKSFEEKMQHQKLVSSKIIENQENEQNRIAKDIHDGIGQMLTGLNFNLQSIDIARPQKAADKLEHLKELTGQIIKGVRTATFNLMPPELSDHGIVPALTKLTHELSRLTGKNILLYDKTGFNMRMDSLVEINIYRITQEAINNAIKYAESSHIIVTVSHSNTLLSVTVDDNGKGFDPKKQEKKNNNSEGMGMTFMKERTQYINGRLFVASDIGKGTKVTLNIPLEKEENISSKIH